MNPGNSKFRKTKQKMKHLPLRRVEYCIPGPGANVNIDFESRKLSLGGDIGLKVSATIYPGFSAGLTASADELVFSLEGIMEDSDHINSCSGLLVLDNLTNGQEPEDREWHATLYLYDDHIDGRELKLKMTMYALSANAELN
jgi:hypothetical protein